MKLRENIFISRLVVPMDENVLSKMQTVDVSNKWKIRMQKVRLCEKSRKRRKKHN